MALLCPYLHVNHQIGLAAAEKRSISPKIGLLEDGKLDHASPSGPRYKEIGFIADMAAQMIASNLVISRAGAITCSELLPTHTLLLLIPLPFATENHQHHNAISTQGSEVAAMMSQTYDDDEYDEVQQLKPDVLCACVLELLGDSEKLRQMKAHAVARGQEAATQEIALFQTASDPALVPDVLRRFEPESEPDAKVFVQHTFEVLLSLS